jgi:hypothetical protein
LRALQKHATQGPWPKTFAEFAARFRAFSGQSATPGQLPLTRYLLVREAKGAEALPKESHSFVDGLRLPEELADLMTPSIDGHSLTEFIDNRQSVLDALMTMKKNTSAASVERKNHSARIDRRDMLIDQAIGLAAGLTVSIAPHPIVIPNSSNKLVVTVSNHGQMSPWLIATYADAGDRNVERFGEIIDKRSHQLMPGKSETLTLPYSVPANASITIPNSQHLYDGLLFSQSATMRITLKLNGVEFALKSATPVDIAPPVEIKSVQPSLVVLTPQTESRPPSLQVTVVSHLNQTTNVWVGAFGNEPGRSSTSLVESVPPPLASGESVDLPMNARLRIQNFSNIEVSAAVEKGKTRSVVAKATLPIIRADARVAPSLNVGYVRGFDFSLPNALAALGVESKELSVDDVKTADLSKYTSIIIDNRVYESQPELIAANQKLLDYANAGGTLIVFYHKSNEWNPDERRKRPQLAPYKLILGDERVTDETAPITFLEPDHPLLNFPNKMGQEDFANWIQERGLYYPKEWDPQYHALLQSNDPGETPLKGGLLVADYGRGHYIYTSMVWYRELRGGIPGAYRMLANMISYAHSK